ncbi:hypothetical protein PFHG_01737 [Plasmodium falciparum HB3]|uniref:Uncharacterized protein n=2 Tax=Plasmodium falciparum TaxID=5833 RepID=A0A0L7KAL8_PLAFX|nr:hypothetical protein PFHG_01737 [Plasmodium falciparum HB3]
MKKCISLIFVLFINKIVGVKIHLYRKYPNVENGVYQIDSRGRPIKIVDVNYNHRWEIPENGNINSYSVVRKNGKVKKFSEGTNLIYGTTKRKLINDIKEVDEQSEEEIKNLILKNKKLNIIKNVSDVSKKEKNIKELEKKKKEKPPIAMYIAADDIPDDKKKKQEEEDYSGPCAHIMILEPMNAKEKSSIAKDCKGY